MEILTIVKFHTHYSAFYLMLDRNAEQGEIFQCKINDISDERRILWSFSG